MDYRSFIATSPDLAGASGALLALLLIWVLVWKGLALWRAARRKETAWFVALLILNTLGILEIIYYFLIAKSDKK
jgi:hypothetical protein